MEKKKAKELHCRLSSNAILNGVISAANQATDLPQLLDHILVESLRLLDYDAGGIYLVNRAKRTASVVHSLNLPQEFLDEIRTIDVDNIPYDKIFNKGEPLFIENYAQFSPIRSKRFGFLSVASIPLLSKGKSIGSLNIISTRRHEISQEEKQTLVSIGKELGSAIERMTAEKEARNAARNFEALFNSIDDMLFVLDLQGKILLVNDTVIKKLAFSMEELVGTDVLTLHAPERRDEALGIVQGMIAGTIDSCPVPVCAKDGTRIEVETKITRGWWNNQEVLIGVTRDITDRKKFEEALKQSGARFQKLVENLPLPMCIIGKNDAIIYINDQFTQIFGYTLEDVPDLSAWNQLAFPDERYRRQVLEQIKSIIRQATFEDKNDVQPVEIKVTCQSRALHDVLVTGNINDENTVLIFTDITEKKRSDRLLQVAYDRRRRNDLLNELICTEHPSEQLLFNVSMMIGKNTREPFTCFLITIDEQAEELVSTEHERLWKYHLRVDLTIDALENIDQIAWESPEGVGVVCFDHHLADQIIDAQKEKAKQLRDTICRQVPNVSVSIGVAEISGSLAELGVRFRQAEMTAKTGAKIWPQQKVYHYLELGVFQVFACLTHESQVAEFIDRSLGRLLNYEKKKKEEYLATLEIILESDNLKESASKLAIHYHSLLFRKQRLEKILGVSLDSISVRMSILTALQLLKLRK